MGLDGVLHLLGGDVLAATPDHVLLAVDEIEEAVLVQASHVAGVEPAFPEGLLGLNVIAPVAGGNGWVVQHDFACHAHGQRVVIVVDNGDLILESQVGVLPWLA